MKKIETTSNLYNNLYLYNTQKAVRVIINLVDTYALFKRKTRFQRALKSFRGMIQI